jgi:hypothetical protein
MPCIRILVTPCRKCGESRICAIIPCIASAIPCIWLTRCSSHTGCCCQCRSPTKVRSNTGASSIVICSRGTNTLGSIPVRVRQMSTIECIIMHTGACATIHKLRCTLACLLCSIPTGTRQDILTYPTCIHRGIRVFIHTGIHTGHGFSITEPRSHTC